MTCGRPFGRHPLGSVAGAFRVALVVALLASAPAQGTPKLAPGHETVITLEGGTQTAFPLTLTAGDFVRAVVVQDGIDVVARLRAPEGSTVVEMDSPNGTAGPEPIAAVVETSGTYQLEVASLDGRAAAGQCRVRLEIVRAARDSDRAWARAEAAMARAAVLAWSGRRPALEEAIVRYQDAMDHWRQADRAADEAATQLALGHVLRRLARHDEARSHFAAALTHYNRLGDVAGVARAHNALCLAEQAVGRLEVALDHCAQALAGFDQLADETRAGRALNNMGLIHQRAGRWTDALDAYRRAMPLLQTAGETHTYAVTLSNAGAVHDALGDYAQALAQFEEALPILQAKGDRRRVAETLNNMGLALRHRGDLQTAIDRFDQAGTAFEALGDDSRAASIRLNQSSLDAWLGRPERCIAQLVPLLPGFAARNEPTEHANALRTVSRCQALLGRHDQAVPGLASALTFYRVADDQAGEATTARALGQAHLALGDLDAARRSFDMADSLARDMGRRPLQRLVAQDLASVHLAHDDVKAAEAQARRALALADELGDPRARFEARRVAATVARAGSHLALVIEHAEAGLAHAESLRAELISPGLRTSFFSTLRGLYELAIDAHVTRHQAASRASAGADADADAVADAVHDDLAAAFALAERARARTLLELVDSPIRPDIGSSARRAQRDRLRRQIEALASSDEGPDIETSRGVATRDAALRDLLEALDTLDTRVRQEDPAFSRIVAPEPVSLQRVRTHLLGPDDLLLSYVLGEERSFVFAITSDHLRVEILPGRTTVEAQAAPVAAQWQTLDLTAQATQAQAAATLATTLLGPIAPLLKDRRLLVVPDGALAMVPFAALPRPTDGTPLIEAHAIAMLSSASVLEALRTRAEDNADTSVRSAADAAMALVIADPVFDAQDPRLSGGPAPAATTRQLEAGTYPRLTASRREGEAVAAVTAGHGTTRVALDFDAERGLLLDPAARHYRLLHLATHAVLDDRHPALSGVVLSRVTPSGSPRDGFLRLHEIYGLPLNADLVVLSACSTAAGTVVRGEGLIGLTHGFLAAGATTVVATLWPIDDRAGAAFMGHFYSALLRDAQSPAEALRTAQQALRSRGRWRHPYYWAGYVVQGDALRPLDLTKTIQPTK